MAHNATATVKTLVVTDLVDSTRLFQTLGDLEAARLSELHERLARDLLVGSSGREIDKTDGFLLVFDRAIDAVGFALRYHQRLAELAKTENVDLAARVGIHLGEVIERRNTPEDVARGAKPLEIEGVAKPVAARVMALADGRQTLLTRSAFDLARQSASTERFEVEGRLRWLAHGSYHLKGVAEPVEIFEVGVSGFAPLLVPKSTAKAKRAVSAEEELTLGWRPAPGLEVPRRPKWFLTEKLGEGGFGEVWLAHHGKTSEARVFKFCYQADRLRSLQREVTLFRLLKETLGSRQDIARILDWNFEKAPYFLESEYTEGGNLLEWTAEQGGADAIPRARRLEVIAQVAEALSAAHSVGVLHKDVKPSNVLLTTSASGDPHVRLTDFGIGVVTDRGVLADQGITLFELTEMVADGTGSAGGTHLYMAPELVEGRTPTVQADIYALGVMLYQYLVGDFSRALATGWRRDLDDELLIEDIAAMVDGHPERRLRDAREVAERLRTLEERRALRETERREREEREAERRALERAQRRRKISVLIAAATTVVLVVVSILAYQAIEARKEAERRRAQAENLIGFMVGDLREKLQPIGRLDILDEVGDQALAYFDAVPPDNLTDDEIFRRCQALYQIGDVRAGQGDLDSAMVAYGESVDLARQLVATDPGNARWVQSLGAGHFGVGFVHWRRNELSEAERQFRQYLDLAFSLTELEPENPDWQLEVAYARSNIGTVLQSAGDLDAALEEFEQSLALRRALVEHEPEHTDYLVGLAVAHNKVGSVLEARGNLEAALSHYQADLEIKRSLVERDSANTYWKQLLATSHNFMGATLEALDRLDEALIHFKEGKGLAQELVLLDASNLRWVRDLAAHRLRLGTCWLTLGRSHEAITEYREAEELLRRLVRQDPSDYRWQLDLAGARTHLGEALMLRGQLAQAEIEVATAQDSLETLLAERPEDRLARLYFQMNQNIRGQLLTRLGDVEDARSAWRKGLEALEPFARDSDDKRYLDAYARALLYLDRVEDAAPIVSRLRQLGYRHRGFFNACRDAGLSVPLRDDARHLDSPEAATTQP